MALQWYVVHAYSGFENQVKRSLEDRIKRFALDEKFGQILVPTEEVIEMRDGQKRKSDRKFFPGYVLVQMEMDESSWHLVKDCPKVMGFIGGTSDKPTPITEREAQTILNRIQEAPRSPSRRFCLRWVKSFGWLTARSPISTAWSRKSITKRAACVWRCRFLDVPPRSNSNSARCRRTEAYRLHCRAHRRPPARDLSPDRGAARRLDPREILKNGQEDRSLYQAAGRSG